MEQRKGEALERSLPSPNGTPVKAVNRLHDAFPELPDLNGNQVHLDPQPVLAVFCYEDPDSIVSQFVGKLAGALASQQIDMHLFLRKGFELDATGVSVHVTGESSEGDLLNRVQDFTRRACNAFLKRFQGVSAPITLMGCEWSSVPTLSILRGIKTSTPFYRCTRWNASAVT